MPVLREDHLDDAEFIAFARDVLPSDEREDALAHLDLCRQCRERLEALHQEEDGTGSTRLSDPLLGQMLGEYRVERALSRGGMGAVYKGLQPVIGKKVAIKVLLPDIAADQNQMHRLLEEARAVNAIRHPNIIDVFSFGDLPDGRHYFVMELLEGQPLDELLASKGRLSASEVLTVLEQSMSALGAAHASGVIHRDLKPANLFVTVLQDQSWHVTVLDFGLAKRGGVSGGTLPNMVMGTPGFMAPEQIRGQEVTARTDLYSMGVVAWVLLTGQEPFEAPNVMELMMRHLDTALPELAPLAPSCPPSLVALVTRLLEKHPDDRPASAMEVLSEVHRIRNERASRARPLVLPPRQRNTGPRHPAAPAPADPTEISAEPTVIAPKRQLKPVTPPPAAPAPLARDTALTPAPKPARKLAPTRGPSRTLLALGASVALVAVAGVGWFLAKDLAVKPPSPTDVPTPPIVPPVAVKPTPVEPTPVEPTPVEPTPVEPTPVEPTPVEPTPVEPTPVEPTPVEPLPVKPPPVKPPPVKPPPVKPDPVETQPRAGSGLSRVLLEKRFEHARRRAASLGTAAARRMFTLDLDRLEKRLAAGEPPRTVNRDLSELLDNYGVR